MKNILQKLYYYSPYIPIIGIFIMALHLIFAKSELGLCAYENNLHFRFSMYLEWIFIIILILLFK